MVDRKVRGLKWSFVAVVTFSAFGTKGRPNGSAASVDYGGKDRFILVCNAHTVTNAFRPSGLIPYFRTERDFRGDTRPNSVCATCEEGVTNWQNSLCGTRLRSLPLIRPVGFQNRSLVGFVPNVAHRQRPQLRFLSEQNGSAMMLPPPEFDGDQFCTVETHKGNDHKTVDRYDAQIKKVPNECWA